jgi:two-component system nitrate/nitrite response regulator NarL
MMLYSDLSTGMTVPVTPIGVLVVDDQLAVREGVARLITSAPLVLSLVGSVATGAEALSAVSRLHPMVVVLDADLAGEDGLALIPQLERSSRVLILTSHGDRATRERAARLGALAFIEKHQPAAELLRSIIDLGKRPLRG